MAYLCAANTHEQVCVYCVDAYRLDAGVAFPSFAADLHHDRGDEGRVEVQLHPSIAPLITDLPAEPVVMDTSNYYPMRDGTIDAIEAGQVESLWVAEQLGRPVVKAWNSIGSDSFAKKGKPAGSPDRIALPVAADRETDRKVGMALVGDMANGAL